jgi:hypothetical protein
MNATEIEKAISELAEQPFDPAEFAYQFLAAFGNKDTTLKRLRSGNSNQSDVPRGVLQRSNIHIATCEVGAVDATLTALRESPKTTSAKATFILATDGETLQAEELIGGETVACDFADLPNRFGFFLSLAGITPVKQIRENTFDIRATNRLNKLYLELLNDNPEWAAADRRVDMNHFIARLIFCFFAEDTDIFNGERLFTQTIEKMSDRDSNNTHEIIGNIFRAMDTKISERASSGTPPHAGVFPYVNGELFSGSFDVPRFSKISRSYLIHIGNLDWTKINPDIFGSMIQAVADDEERGSLGMHYTSVPNILKVLNPLFLDDLREKLEEAGDNPRKLANLRSRMAKIRLFDPACGSGNFLVVGYKQMREIEAEINRRRSEAARATDIPLTNFRGIELRDFPAEIARLALIIAEFQCDQVYRGQQLALAEFLPLNAENWITCGNALRLDWLSICPPTGIRVKLQADDLFGTPLDQAQIDFENEGGETYICGNPPYYGSRRQEEEQKSEIKAIAGAQINKWKSLDYVAGWLLKASNYAKIQDCRFAFVCTSSISEGLQVSLMWPHILGHDRKIIFAHRPFKWSNLAKHNAGVSVVIVGVSSIYDKCALRIFDDSNVKSVDAINPYLVAASTVYVDTQPAPLTGHARMVMGSMPRDGGNLILDQSSVDSICKKHPNVRELIRKYVGSDEIIKGNPRYCLWIRDFDRAHAESIPELRERFEAVRNMRQNSTLDSTVEFSDRPHRFVYLAGESKYRTVAIGGVSSENREYLPVDILEPSVVVSNLAYAMYDAPIWTSALLLSKLHMAWTRAVCGKRGTSLRYSNTLGWNTFPVPPLTERNKADLNSCAENILLAREAHFPKTIADLYDPEVMPDNLRAAHDANDEVLERIFIGRRFKNDTERLEKLFELYTKMTGKAKAA